MLESGLRAHNALDYVLEGRLSGRIPQGGLSGWILQGGLPVWSGATIGGGSWLNVSGGVDLLEGGLRTHCTLDCSPLVWLCGVLGDGIGYVRRDGVVVVLAPALGLPRDRNNRHDSGTESALNRLELNFLLTWRTRKVLEKRLLE